MLRDCFRRLAMNFKSGFAIIAVMSATQTSAETLSVPTRNLFGTYIAAPDQFDSVGKREAFIEAVANYCEEISEVYPTNSPAELAWLEQEQQGSFDRVSRSLGSAEFGRKMTSNFTSGCADYVTMYRQNKNRNVALAGLAYTFSTYEKNSENSAKLNNISSDYYGFLVLNTVTRSILVAAMFEAATAKNEN